MAARTEWTGTASELLGALAEVAGERVAKAKTWPDSPRALAGRLRRAATFLRKIGIEIGFDREGRARTRMIRITTAPPSRAGNGRGATVRTVRIVRADAEIQSGQRLRGTRPADGRQRSRTVSGGGPVATVRANPLKSNGRDRCGRCGRKHPPQSAPEKTGWRARL